MASMAQSVLQQTRGFQEWIILDDGSTDGTSAVLSELEASVPTITVHRLTDTRPNELGQRVSSLVQHGLQRAANQNWDYWAKLDADLLLAPDYFECLLAAFANDPGLGIASGRALLPGRSDTWRAEWTPDYFPLGMARIYRRACWSDIGGYVADRHFDIIDVYSARHKGWRTASVPETHAKLLRRVGARVEGRLGRRLDAGHGLYGIGYLPAYFLLRAVRSMWDEQPPVLAALAMMCGYLRGALRRTRLVDVDLFHFVRREQRSLVRAENLIRYWHERTGSRSTRPAP